ncbi:MAG TPA: hypothetical protein VEX13_02460 [Chloroflexia bacterium]|nr:hypothetical protein [Chloroflexia bacterium]
MIGAKQKKKGGIFSTCLVPILTIVGLVGGCFLLCTAIFLLNQASVRATAGF